MYGRYRFDEGRARRAVKFIESLVLTDGEWARQRFRLHPTQKYHTRQIFGWIDAETGYRRYRTAYIEIARKSGKSEWASAIGTYLLMADGYEGAEVYSAAKDGKQATRTYKPAARRIDLQPALARRLEKYDSVMRIVYPEMGSFWQVLPGTVPDAWGLNVHGLLFDEVHAHKNSELFDALDTGTASQPESLTFIITTAGTRKNLFAWNLHRRALRAIKHPELDPTFYAAIYAADEQDDWKSEATWRKANPLYPTTPKREYMMAAKKRALEDPAFLNTFKRVHLNIWTQQLSRYIPPEAWYDCPVRLSDDVLKGRLCYGGLDLASVQDLVAFSLVFPPTEAEPFWDVLIKHFCPLDSIEIRSKRDRVQYDVWKEQGKLIATPGNAIEHDIVEEHILQAKHAGYKIGAIGYDRWGAIEIISHLSAAGFKTLPVGMGYGSLSAPTKEFLKLILTGKFRHADDPVLEWQIDNLAVAEQMTTGDVKPAKNVSGEKIDGVVATIIALFCALNLGTKKRESVYKTRGATVYGAGEKPAPQKEEGDVETEEDSEAEDRGGRSGTV